MQHSIKLHIHDLHCFDILFLFVLSCLTTCVRCGISYNTRLGTVILMYLSYGFAYQNLRCITFLRILNMTCNCSKNSFHNARCNHWYSRMNSCRFSLSCVFPHPATLQPTVLPASRIWLITVRSLRISCGSRSSCGSTGASLMVWTTNRASAAVNYMLFNMTDQKHHPYMCIE